MEGTGEMGNLFRVTSSTDLIHYLYYTVSISDYLCVSQFLFRTKTALMPLSSCLLFFRLSNTDQNPGADTFNMIDTVLNLKVVD